MKYADRPESWKEAERARCRAKAYRYKKSPENNRACNKRYQERHRAKCRSVARNQVKAAPGFECHHWNYNPGYCSSVIQLTHKQHMAAHRFLRYDEETMLYRTIDGELLDTKEKHENYIAQWIN